MELQLRELESNYPIENFRIKLTPNHSLVKNVNNHPLYNQFPKFLVSLLQPGTVVLEVGTNVGDNLARMISSRGDLQYVPIEPIEEYYKFLLKNIEIFKNQIPVLITPLNVTIASKLEISEFEISEGTAKAIINQTNETKIETVTLDQTVSAQDHRRVSLIFTDTDGFDYDVIYSAEEIIDASHPVIFFEFMCTSNEILNEYQKLLEYLDEKNYVDFAIFDNFGNLMSKESKKSDVLNLAQYAFLQNCNVGTRTIYYLDVLTWTAKNHDMINEVISKFIVEAEKSAK
jgi:FkbM family methyltransferase